MTQDELRLAAEYHRGYEDGKAARDAQEWKLQQERDELIRELREIDKNGIWFDIDDVLGVEHRYEVPERLIYLLGGIS